MAMLRRLSRLWPLIVILGVLIAITSVYLLPNDHPLVMSIAALAGGAAGSLEDPLVLVAAIIFGLTVRHIAVAIGIAALLGFLLQFPSIFGFRDQAGGAIVARAVALLAGMVVIGLIPLAWRALTRKRAIASVTPVKSPQ